MMKTRKINAIAIILMGLIVWSPVLAGKDPKRLVDPNRRTVKHMNRSIRKEVKSLSKDGYSVEPGAPAMEWQLRKSYDKEFMVDDQGYNQFVIGVGSAISGIQNAARRHAVSDAGIDASTLLESQILGLIENDYNNKLYSRNEYQTLSRMKGVFSNLLANRLPAGVPVCTLIRDNGKFYDYQIRVAFSARLIAEESNLVVSEILGKENDELRKKFERITGLDQMGLPGSDEVERD